MDKIKFPNWIPQVEKNSKILIAGASGGIGNALVKLLMEGPDSIIGFHRSSSENIPKSNSSNHKLIDLKLTLSNDEKCNALVDNFTNIADGLDALVVLCGGINNSDHWKNINEDDWNEDINLNLSIPFFLARSAMEKMKTGGHIILVGTESAIHGGSPTSLAYGVAKRGIECLVQGLARDGSKHNILVNGIRLGFINSGFHERWQGKTPHEIEKRIELIPLKRGGEPKEAAAFIIYLLSGWSGFITGQMFPITGGDWL
jgi:NAD(P)-dependent dehydrogenase (short-subunit alcohol dehydrogenase family)